VDKAPAKLIKPARSQQEITSRGEPSSAYIGAIFLNTPEPTITLTTKTMADRNPIFANSLFILNLRFYILSNPKPGYNFGSFFNDFKHIRG